MYNGVVDMEKWWGKFVTWCSTTAQPHSLHAFRERVHTVRRLYESGRRTKKIQQPVTCNDPEPVSSTTNPHNPFRWYKSQCYHTRTLLVVFKFSSVKNGISSLFTSKNWLARIEFYMSEWGNVVNRNTHIFLHTTVKVFIELFICNCFAYSRYRHMLKVKGKFVLLLQ